MEPHSALIKFNRCKVSSRERNKDCSIESTRSAPKDGIYHLCLAWPRKKRQSWEERTIQAHRKGELPETETSQGLRCGAESGLLLPSSHTWPLQPELKRTQARHEGFPGRSSRWPVPLGTFHCHTLSLHFSWIPRVRMASYPPGSSVRLLAISISLFT